VKARKRVLDPAHAYEMTSVLSDNNARCTVQVCEFGLNSPLLLDRPAAAKTGTTNDWTDNWTLGYTPQLVTGVWVGNADRSPMINVIGITGAAPIWHTYMESAFKILKLPVANFVQPSNVVTSSLCTPAGTLPGTNYTATMGEDLVVGSAQSTKYPLCSIPEKGSLPISCDKYPKPLPFGWACPSGYTYYTTPAGTPGTTSYYGTQPQTGTTQYGTTPYGTSPYSNGTTGSTGYSQGTTTLQP
jgi:membrane peptidoglycan carboxypeptidase